MKNMKYKIHKKITKKLSLWNELKTAEENAKDGIPVLQFGRDEQKQYVILEVDDFFKLIKGANDECNCTR